MGFPSQVTHIQVVLQAWNIEYTGCGRLSLTYWGKKHAAYLNVLIMDVWKLWAITFVDLFWMLLLVALPTKAQVC